ncbi:MAG: replication initiator protein [Microviridae sp.]|nr:MAG: replication initiator protein [Microviridae sp.]
MCITPSHVWVERGPKYEKQVVPCRKCWRCRSNRVNDYVGRCLCEAETSVKTIAVTLTYAPRDDLAEKVINPRHFQLFMKSLRASGHKVRYLVVAEYGELRGRVHFHAILFFQAGPKAPPEYPQQTNFHSKEWPHGHMFADNNSDEKALRYTCKYVLKGEAGTFWMSVSKNPALGWGYFKKKAQLSASYDVMPASFSYQPPNATVGRPYMLRGAVRRDYLALIKNLIEFNRIIKRSSLNEWVLKAVEKLELWQAQREIAKNPISDHEFMERMKEDIDKSRISVQSAATVVFHSHWAQLLRLNDDKMIKVLKEWRKRLHQEVEDRAQLALLALQETPLLNPSAPILAVQHSGYIRQT